MAINNNECKFDSNLNDELQLPYFTFNGVKNFGGVMWADCDYKIYYIRKNFSDYEFYWMI